MSYILTTMLLQEWVGYCLVHDISQAKFLLLVGDGANGKSVVLAVLRALLGDTNVSAVGLEGFDYERTFAMAATILNYPIEFHIYGFNYAMGAETDPEDRAKILSGLFSFTFCGRRSYLQCPLIGMPSERRRKPVSEIVARVVKLSGEIAERMVDVSKKRCDEDRAALRREIDDEMLFDFLVGGEALQIKPGEAFGVQYAWPAPIEVKKPVLLYAFIDGLMWRPI